MVGKILAAPSGVKLELSARIGKNEEKSICRYLNHDTAGICSTIIQVDEVEFEKANYWPPDNSHPDNSYPDSSYADFL